jgi:hypothetical protein
VLRKIFRSKSADLSEQFRTIHKADYRDLYISGSAVHTMKSRKCDGQGTGKKRARTGLRWRKSLATQWLGKPYKK